MKKIILTLAVVVSLTNCKKEAKSNDTTQVITANIAANERFTYDMGAIPAQDLKVSQAGHAVVSQVSTVPGGSTTLYEYVPDSNYVGSDQVTIVLQPHHPGAKGGCQKNNPPAKNNGCQKNTASCNHDSKTTYVFNINVAGKTLPDK